MDKLTEYHPFSEDDNTGEENNGNEMQNDCPQEPSPEEEYLPLQ